MIKNFLTLCFLLGAGNFVFCLDKKTGDQTSPLVPIGITLMVLGGGGLGFSLYYEDYVKKSPNGSGSYLVKYSPFDPAYSNVSLTDLIMIYQNDLNLVQAIRITSISAAGVGLVLTVFGVLISPEKNPFRVRSNSPFSLYPIISPEALGVTVVRSL